MNKDKPINPPKVIVVDDNVKNLQVLGGLLQNEEIEVEFALDGTSALEWLEKEKFDLILLDIMMPGMDGYEVCTVIKKNPSISEIPIIFITAKTDSDSIVKGFEYGAVDYVAKPFNRSELLARVNTQIEIKRSRDKLRLNMLEIEDRNRNITDSIKYARNIQRAIINKSKTISKMLPEHFVLFLPKDIVSGDFYWFCKVDDTIIIAVMDCTGHGVPGAFMSILGVTMLNEIVLNKKIFQPDEILQHLRGEIISSLGQKGVINDVKDGMEGSVVCYDQLTGILRFSGSVNPLILIHENEISEIKADRFPIGWFERMEKFTLNEIEVKKNDIIYLFSDGYPDQFGGFESKKFMRKRFKDLLFKNHHLSLAEQKEALSETHILWKGIMEQTDDIVVMGIRF